MTDRKRLHSVCVALAGVWLAFGVSVQASERVWQGGTGRWNLTDQNWLVGGATGLFVSGADVRFDDTAAAKTVTLDGDMSAGTVIFDISVDYTLESNKLVAATNFIKRGAGELRITGIDHTFTGDILIEEGTITTMTKDDRHNASAGALGHPRNVPRAITVLTNGTLNFVGEGPFGGGTSSSPVLTDLRIIGGTLNLTTNFGNNLGSVLFDNATINYYGGYNIEGGGYGPGKRNWGTWNFGSNVTFRGQDAYTFDQRPSTGGRTCVINMGKHRPTELWVDDITGDDEPDVIFAIPVANVARDNGITTRFTKTGPGTLSLESSLNDFTGNVSVVEGTLMANKDFASLTAPNSVLGNPRVHHEIFVGTNATLHFAQSDIMGQAWSHPLIEIIVSGGTLTQTVNKVNAFGPLTLDNATLVYSGSNWDWGTFIFDGDVTFKGTNAYHLPPVNNSRVRSGYNRIPYFIVEDITGDTKVDVTLGMQIDDCIAWGTNAEARPSRFGKKGAGTLSVTNHASTFTGDIDVAGGVLELPYGGSSENKTTSVLGNPQTAQKKLIIRDGGEVFFQASDVFGQLATWVKMETVVSNGTLRIGDSRCNGFGPLTLYNANIVYNGGGRSDYGNGNVRTWGTLGFGECVTLDGTAPYTFQVKGSNCRFNLSYAADHAVEPAGTLTNYHGKTEFLVRDITGDAQSDVTLEVPLQDIPPWPSASRFRNIIFKCGLIKSGEGTLSLASTDNTYTGPTVVREGALRVDGTLTTSAVTVEVGGYLGGEGTVASATFENGAGFEVTSDQATPLTINALTAAGGGIVRVRAPQGFELTSLNAPFLKTTPAIDPAKWKVVVDNAEPSANARVMIAADGTAYARWALLGTVISIK